MKGGMKNYFCGVTLFVIRVFMLLMSGLVLSCDEPFGIDGGGSAIARGSYSLLNGVLAYVASGKSAGYLGLHLLIGNDMAGRI